MESPCEMCHKPITATAAPTRNAAMPAMGMAIFRSKSARDTASILRGTRNSVRRVMGSDLVGRWQGPHPHEKVAGFRLLKRSKGLQNDTAHGNNSTRMVNEILIDFPSSALSRRLSERSATGSYARCTYVGQDRANSPQNKDRNSPEFGPRQKRGEGTKTELLGDEM